MKLVSQRLYVMKRTRFITRILALLVTISYTFVPQTQAGVAHQDATIQTYTDFGQNMGRYKVGGEVNALLKHLNQGGYVITYTGGQADFTLPHDMIDFESAGDIGAYVAIGNNFIATVAHNGVQNPTFTGRYIGDKHAVHYATIEYRYNYTISDNTFCLRPDIDYKIARTSKLITDVESSTVYNKNMNTQEMVGQYIYRTGSGSQFWMDYNGVEHYRAGGYAYMTGGMVSLQNAQDSVADPNNRTPDLRGIMDDSFSMSITFTNWSNGTINEQNPLPFVIRGGDSGSPAWMWNSETSQYEFVCAGQAGSTYLAVARGANEWTLDTMDSFNNEVNLGSDTNTVYLNAVTDTRWEEQLYCDIQDVYGTPTYGTVTDAQGNKLAEFAGVKQGGNTWKDLSSLKDKQQWYAYGNDFLNASQRATAESGKLDYADLFLTENLVFKAARENTEIQLTADVDMGLGYMEFSAGDIEKARFTISANGDYMLDTAGYIVGKNTELHIQLTNKDQDFVREWRKTGDGALFLEDTGNNEIFLNLGGKGTTYLQQQGGYAAYNVLLNTGAKLVIDNTQQIARDLTFGAGGGTLDMNGNSMEWYNTNPHVDAAHFSINALTEEAFITNCKDDSTLTFKQSGQQKFVGSFQDSTTGSLTIVYDGGTDSRWDLHSIHTDLTKNNKSGFIVNSGTAALSGTNTVHAIGSETGTSQRRLVEPDDWHYADAKMNVTVKDGGTFELGSHARLTGDISVEKGGTFIMKEGVKHRMEYLEGGYKRQDTYDFREFYGLKGNISLAEGSAMRVDYSEGVTATTQYDYTISGSGSLTINAGTSGGSITLIGDNSQFTGSRTIESGGLIATRVEALGGNIDTHKWHVKESGFIAMTFETGVEDLRQYITSDSTGVLALTKDRATTFDLTQSHTGLVIGALEGTTVHYGTADTQLQTVTIDGKKLWALGGGGGELVVHSRLTGDASLYLGSDSFSLGTVTLTNTNNDFTGDIIFRGTGVLLNALEGTLGTATLDLSYGNGFLASYATVTERLTSNSEGMLMADKLGDAGIDLSGHSQLAIGASSDTTFSGHIQLAEGANYLLGATADGKLNITSELDSNKKLIIDAQGHSGGTVQISGNNVWTGDVIVRGHRSEVGVGSISLAAGTDIDINGTVDVANGSALDVAGHKVTLHNTLSGGGFIIDSSGSGELIFDTSNANMSPEAQLNLTNVRKQGDNTLTLSGAHSYTNLYVDGGTLALVGNEADCSSGTIHLADGTNLTAGSIDFNSVVRAASGTATLTNTGTGTLILSGGITQAEGATLNLAGNGSFRMNAGTYGTTGGTINLQSNRLQLASGTAIEIAGTLQVSNDATIYTSGSKDDMERTIEHLHITGGKTAILSEESWNTIWNIDNLTGEGTLKWDSNTTHEFNSRMVLQGNGGFTGTIQMDRRYENTERTHGAYLVLASDNVAKNADIKLNGRSARAVATMAINTNNAAMKGLTGNEHSYVYAGTYVEDAAMSGEERPATTRHATITIDTEAATTHTYAGQLGHSSDTNEKGIDLVKTGSGTQEFTGETYVGDVTVKGGTLHATNMTVRKDISLAYGASLSGLDYTLGEGLNFNVLAGEGSNSATFSGTLTLAGGALNFDAATLLSAGAGNAALSLNGLKFEGISAQTINFTNVGGLELNTTYMIASGNWSTFTGNITATGLEHYTTSFGKTANGLTLTLSTTDGAIIWNGSNYAQWGSNFFGEYNNSTAGKTVVFDDSSSNKNIEIVGTTSATKALFVASENYSISEGYSYNEQCHATVGELTHAGTGTTTINSGMTVTGATDIVSGELIITSADQLQGVISGEGTLGVKWSGANTLNIKGLDTLHIISGSYGSDDWGYNNGTISGPAWDIDNIILEKGTTFIQGYAIAQQTNIISNGGALSVNAGSLSGEMILNADTNIDYRTNDGANAGHFYLNSGVTDNGHRLTQTGTGKMVIIGGSSSAVFSDYFIESGTLKFEGKTHSDWGTITVDGSDATLHAASILSADKIVLNGGNLRIDNRNTTANVVVNSSGTLTGSAAGSISGTGTLNINKNGGYISSTISDEDGALSINYTGSGIATVSGMNTYTGGTNISDGLVITNSGQALGQGLVNISSSATLQLNRQLWINGLEGAGILNLNGNTLTIDTNGNHEFSGTTYGTAGVLLVGGNGTSSFTGGNKSFRSVGVNGGKVNFSGSTTISGETLVQAGNLSFSGETILGTNTTVDAGASLSLSGSIGLTSSILNAGMVTINDGASLSLNLNQFEDQRFTIINGGNFSVGSGLSYSIDGYTLDSSNYSISNTNNLLTITLQNVGRDVTWNGDANDHWNNSDQNWTTADGSTAFGLLDKATFNDTATNKSVFIEEGINAAYVTISGKNYHFSGSSLKVHNDLTITEGASASFDNGFDIRGNFIVNGEVSLEQLPTSGMGTVTVNGTLNLNADGTWTQQLDASKGIVNKNGSGSLAWNPDEKLRVGTFNVTKGSFSTESAANIGSLNLSENTNVTLINNEASSGGDKVITKTILGNQATITVDNKAQASEATSLGEVQLNGSSATIQDATSAGYIHLAKLTHSEQGAKGNLNLNSQASTGTTVFELGTAGAQGGNFNGTVTLSGDNANIILAGENVAQHATIHLANSGNLGLGLKVNNAVIGGLDSANTNATLFSNDETRALIINTLDNHSFAGTVGNSVSLIKRGSGTQSFTGAVSSATVDVQEGILALTGTTSGLTHVSISRGATLELPTLTLSDNMSLNINGTPSTDAATLTGALSLQGGSIVFNAQTLNDYSTALNVSQTISGNSVVSIDNFTSLAEGNYLLISGTGLTNDMFTLNSEAQDINASFKLEDSKLWLVIDTNGQTIWNGTDKDYAWNSGAFSTHEATTASSALLFNDTASNKNVSIGTEVTADTIIFSNSATEGMDYNLSATNLNAAINANSLTVKGGGHVTLDAELNIAESITIENGTINLGGKATLSSTPSIVLKDGSTLNVGYTTQTINGLSMETGSTLTDDNGRGTVILQGGDSGLNSEGLINVGTVKTSGMVSFNTGLAANTLEVLDGYAMVYTSLESNHLSLHNNAGLTIACNFELSENKTITAQGQSNLTAFYSSISLGNGTLIFNSDKLSKDTALLTLSGSISQQENAVTNIAVSDISTLRTGGDFALVQAGFSGSEKFNLSGAHADYVTFNITDGLLSVNVKEHGVWSGNVTNHTWNNSSFGPDAKLSEQAAAIFDDSAKIANIEVAENVKVKDIRFINNEVTYNLTGSNIETTTLSQEGSQETNINNELSYTNGQVAAGTLNLNGKTSSTGTTTISGGTLNLNGAESSLGNVDVTAGSLNISAHQASMASIDLQGASTLAFSKAEGIESNTITITGDLDSSTQNGNRTIDIHEGVTVNTGSLTNTHGINTLHVNGALNIAETMTYAAAGTNTITGSGQINTHTLNIAGNGTHNINISKLSAHNINIEGSNINLQNGNTIIADTVTQNGGKLSIGSNSSMKVMNSSSFNGGEISLSGNGTLELAQGSTSISNILSIASGILAVSGGSHTVNSSTAYINNAYVKIYDGMLDMQQIASQYGAYEIHGGTLKLGANVATDALQDGFVTLTGGILDLSAHDFTSQEISLNYGNKYSLAGGKINLGNLNQNTSYNIFNSASLSTAWSSLNTNNFIINGYDLGKMGNNASVSIGMNGSHATISYSIASSNLTWMGSISENWSGTDLNWKDTDNNTESVYGYGNLSFNYNATNKNVYVSQDVLASSMTILHNGEYSFSGEGSIETTNLELSAVWNGKVAFNNDIIVTGTTTLMADYTLGGSGNMYTQELKLLESGFGSTSYNLENSSLTTQSLSFEKASTINVRSGEFNLLSGLSNTSTNKLTINTETGATINAKGGTHSDTMEVNIASGATLGAIAEEVGGTAMFTNKMNIGTEGSSEAVVFNTDVKTINSYDTTKLDPNVGKGGNVVLSGVRSIDASAVQVTGAGKLWLANNAQTDSNTPQGISIASNNKGVSAAKISGIQSFTREGSIVHLSGADAQNLARVDNALIDIMAGSTLQLENVLLTHTSRITDEAATLEANNVIAEVIFDENATVSNNSATLQTGSVLTQFGDSTQSIVLQENANVLHIDSTLMDTVTVTGTRFTVLLGKISTYTLSEYDYVSLIFTDGEHAATFSTNTAISAITETGHSSVAYYAADTQKLYFDVSAFAVPEPTTSTLSLLALTALAMRRRRK